MRNVLLVYSSRKQVFPGYKCLLVGTKIQIARHEVTALRIAKCPEIEMVFVVYEDGYSGMVARMLDETTKKLIVVLLNVQYLHPRELLKKQNRKLRIVMLSSNAEGSGPSQETLYEVARLLSKGT